VDRGRAQFLFGTADPGFDVEDEDEVAAFFAAELRDMVSEPDVDEWDVLDPSDVDDESDVGLSPLIRTIVARQVLRDEPPEAWQTVTRLQGLGLARDRIMNQMAMAVAREVQLALQDDDAGEAPDAGSTGSQSGTDHYLGLLARLPLPEADTASAVLERVVVSDPGVPIDRARDLTLEELGRAGDELAAAVVDAVLDRAIEADTMEVLPGDRLVVPQSLVAGIVSTHRLAEGEIELDSLMSVGTDLGGFAWYDELSSESGAVADVEPFSLEPGHIGWQGPPGWLRGFAVGDLLAVRVDASATVAIERLDTQPGLDEQLVDRLRRAYDAEVDLVELPARCTDLVLAVLVDDRSAFDRPQRPLRELCEHAGLELRGSFVAHDDALWRAQAQMQRSHRVHDRFDDHERSHVVLDILDLADDTGSSVDDLRDALAQLHDEGVCWGVLDELVDADAALPDEIDTARAFAERLVAAATRPTERMVAHWISAVVAERAGHVIEADAHLHVAMEAGADWGPLIDRGAWYASLRGDARRAAALWHGLEHADTEELHVVESQTRRAGSKRGRNETCWCGSGRKLKHCHADAPEPVPLPDRVGWLASKAAGFLGRHGAGEHDDLFDLAIARATERGAGLDFPSAFADPIVFDLALTELGWFERFLDTFGPLLPDDEALLATSWVLVDRTVYEVEETRPGDGVVVRDLRSGEHLDVRERTMSAHATVGQMVCARAVPDGVTHQFIGAVFAVAPGQERDVLALCDEHDARGLAGYVGAMQRPPRFETREAEPLVSCRIELRVPDPRQARRVLDDAYERDEDGWYEMHDVSEVERILRAQLTLDGNRLSISTSSEPRADRVLARLHRAIPGLETVSDEREPLDADELARSSPAAVGAVDVDPEMREEITDMMERRWMRESIPALGGVTPLDAAADPTRRRELSRLLASFPEPAGGPELTLRPSRLRALLGLTDDD
jgi:hypothetical protein